MLRTRNSLIYTYGIFLLSCTCISLIGLINNIYEISMILAISSFFGLFYLQTSLNFMKSDSGDKNKNHLIIFLLLRFLIISLSIVCCTIALYFSKDLLNLGSKRFLYILIAGFPLLTATLLYTLRSLKYGE